MRLDDAWPAVIAPAAAGALLAFSLAAAFGGAQEAATVAAAPCVAVPGAPLDGLVVFDLASGVAVPRGVPAHRTEVLVVNLPSTAYALATLELPDGSVRASWFEDGPARFADVDLAGACGDLVLRLDDGSAFALPRQ